MFRVPITEQEKNSPYYKYFIRELTPVPEEKIQIAKNCRLRPEDILEIYDMNRLLDEDFQVKGLGFARMKDGTLSVVNHTPMPKVTVEMFDWWFAWHGLEPMRYKIWDPEDHYYCLTRNPEISGNKELSMKERYWNTVHDVVEDASGAEILGIPKPEKGQDVLIAFKNPVDVGFLPEKLEHFNGTVVCSGGEESPCLMCHTFRMTEHGGELITHFWIGYGVVNGKIILLPEEVRNLFPDETGRGLYAHNIKEFTHLAEILPELYEEFAGDF